MTKTSNRDKKTAEMQGILPSTAANIKRMMSKARNEVDEGLTKPPSGGSGGSGGNDTNQTREKLIEKLQKYLFGTEESFPYTTTVEELTALKRWVEDLASQYFMLHAISLFEACYLAEFNHTTRTGVIKELNARMKRFNIILRVINECIMMKTSLRRFTADEQNTFMHG